MGSTSCQNAHRMRAKLAAGAITAGFAICCWTTFLFQAPAFAETPGDQPAVSPGIISAPAYDSSNEADIENSTAAKIGQVDSTSAKTQERRAEATSPTEGAGAAEPAAG